MASLRRLNLMPKSRRRPYRLLVRRAFLLLNARRLDADVLRQSLSVPEFHDALGLLEK